ncbi:glycosyltransferase family 2 protein [Flavobacterium sp.]|uniref:glycosyltransferase family 2 protein n=1 Tax=Flavobacterium sp. TaxID=239 RepID=UPI00374D1059
MKFSVALCTYNGEKYLHQQISSILNQSVKVDEILICDDISTDKTMAILNDFRAKNSDIIKIYSNSENLRSVKNFEKAIKLCTGDIIFLADQDDVWAETKVEEFKTLFQDENTKGIFSDGFLIDKNNDVIHSTSLWNSFNFNPKILSSNLELSKYLTQKNNIATGATMAFRKEIVNEITPFPELNNFHHDQWIALYLALNNNLNYIDKKLISYRIHENQQVGAKLKSNVFKKFKNSIIDQVIFKNQAPPLLTHKKITKLLQQNIKLLKYLFKVSENEKFRKLASNTISNLEARQNYYNERVSILNDFKILTTKLLKY